MLKKLSLLLLTGCMANDGLRTLSMSQDNIWNLSRLCIGMDESEVLQIMHYPYKKQKLECGDSIYSIWFYVTRPSGLNQSRLVRQNLTPLAFEDGVLLGWGFEYYYHVLRRAGEPKNGEKSSEPPKESDRPSLEKAIEGFETKPVTSQNQESSSKQTKKNPKEEQNPPKTNDVNTGEKEDKDPLSEEDNKMIEEGDDQNFNFW